MIAPDVNLLVYAYNRSDPAHSAAAAYWQHLLNHDTPVGIPVLCLHGFVRIFTNSAFPGHVSIRQAGAAVDEWLSNPNIQVLYPGPKHWEILRDLAIRTGCAGKIFTDAAIAAIALEYGATVHTNDRDFARFPGLKWHNPLQS